MTSIHPSRATRRRCVASILGLAWLTLAGGCEPTWCNDSCSLSQDGLCDDGRIGAESGLCALGTDCSDCGPNPAASSPNPNSASDGIGQFTDPNADPTQPIEIGECHLETGTFCLQQSPHDDLYTTQKERSPNPASCGPIVQLGDLDCDTYYEVWPADGVCWVSHLRSCGYNRRCVTDASGQARGCLWLGATEGSRITQCEELGMCEDGRLFEFCEEVPALVPLPRPRARDVEKWFQVGGERLETCQQRSDEIPGGCPHPQDPCSGQLYCPIENLEPCMEVEPEPEIPSCIEHLDLDVPNACVERCARELIDCVNEAGCVAASSCVSSYFSCTDSCV